MDTKKTPDEAKGAVLIFIYPVILYFFFGVFGGFKLGAILSLGYLFIMFTYIVLKIIMDREGGEKDNG